MHFLLRVSALALILAAVLLFLVPIATAAEVVDNEEVSAFVIEQPGPRASPVWQDEPDDPPDIVIPPQPDESDAFGTFLWHWLVVSVPIMVTLEKVIKPWVLDNVPRLEKTWRDVIIIAIVVAYAAYLAFFQDIDVLMGFDFGLEGLPDYMFDIGNTAMIAAGAFFAHLILDILTLWVSIGKLRLKP